MPKCSVRDACSVRDTEITFQIVLHKMNTFHVNCKRKIRRKNQKEWPIGLETLNSYLECMNHIFLYFVITSHGFSVQIMDCQSRYGESFRGPKQSLLYGPKKKKNYCTWMCIDYNVWNQNMNMIKVFFNIQRVIPVWRSPIWHALLRRGRYTMNTTYIFIGPPLTIVFIWIYQYRFFYTHKYVLNTMLIIQFK